MDRKKQKRKLGVCIFFLLGAMAAGGVNGQRDVPLGLELSSLQLQKASIVEALHAIRVEASAEKLFFSLELVPFHRHPESNLSLNFRKTTVGQVLKSIIDQDPRYTFEVLDSKLIHVYPKSAKTNAKDLLNVEVPDVNISGVSYDLILKYPQYHITELQIEITRRSKSGGYAISMMGATEAPKVSVHMKQGTVRDILNSVAQKTEQFPSEVPTGWIYSFRVDPSLPMGGEPTWQTF